MMKLKEDHLGAKSELSRVESAICGGVSGLVSRFVIAPLDVVKIRMQLDPTTVYNHPGRAVFNQFAKIVRNEGFTALWKGNISAEAMYVLYGAIQFSSYKQINTICTHHTNLSDSTIAFISGAGAGTISTTLTYPFDLLRTRFAAQGKQRLYTSLASGVRHIYHDDGGLRGFFRGLLPSIVSIVPYMGLFFASYGEIRKLLEKSRLSFLPAPEASAGFAAGIVAKTVVFPLDVVRKRLQVQGPARESFSSLPAYPSNFVKTMANVVRVEGPRALYRGYFVALIKNAPFTAVTVYTFEKSVTAMHWAKARGFGI